MEILKITNGIINNRGIGMVKQFIILYQSEFKQFFFFYINIMSEFRNIGATQNPGRNPMLNYMF